MMHVSILCYCRWYRQGGMVSYLGNSDQIKPDQDGSSSTGRDITSVDLASLREASMMPSGAKWVYATLFTVVISRIVGVENSTMYLDDRVGKDTLLGI